MSSRGLSVKLKKAGCVLLSAVLLFFAFLPAPRTFAAAPDLETLIESAFAGRAAHAAGGKKLLSDQTFLETSCGTGTGDWAAFAMARYGTVLSNGTMRYYNDDYAAYAETLQTKLQAYYEAQGVKAGTKLTEYFRMGLALTALGGDAAEIILAATVNNNTALKRIALMSLDFGLIAYDMKDLPDAASPAHTRQEVLSRILELRTADGGWALNSLMGGDADVDVTCMTLAALARDYRAGNADVKAAVDGALSLLSGRQSAAGDFGSYGALNAESTAWVIVALTSLGIDPLKDARFIKQGHTALDGLLRYRLPDGSFTHSYVNDPENGAAVAGSYNYLATDEASYALVALWRQQRGLNPLFDLRPDKAHENLLLKLARLFRTLLTRLAEAFTLRAAAEVSPEEAKAAARGIVSCKKAALGLAEDAPLLPALTDAAGSTAGDWYPFGLAALGETDDYAAYLAALRENVRQRYGTVTLLSADKATEWHRVILAALACGADPVRFTVTAAGEPVDLLGDGVFYRENIGRQGVNGFIWALIALHACGRASPADALNTEETLLAALLEKQLPGGGWNMRGDAPDTDVTAMALIALAPMTERFPEAAAAAGTALNVLSASQLENGGFAEENVPNCESCAVTLTALCTLGIAPDADPRFIKNGRTVLDALLGYRLPDGSFTHTNTENETNDMSCQQALYALAAYCRFKETGGSIFDFSSAVLSSEGWDFIPAGPGAAERAKEGLTAFFADEVNRKTAVSIALAVLIVLLAGVLCARRVKKRRERNAP